MSRQAKMTRGLDWLQPTIDPKYELRAWCKPVLCAAHVDLREKGTYCFTYYNFIDLGSPVRLPFGTFLLAAAQRWVRQSDDPDQCKTRYEHKLIAGDSSGGTEVTCDQLLHSTVEALQLGDLIPPRTEEHFSWVYRMAVHCALHYRKHPAAPVTAEADRRAAPPKPAALFAVRPRRIDRPPPPPEKDEFYV